MYQHDGNAGGPSRPCWWILGQPWTCWLQTPFIKLEYLYHHLFSFDLLAFNQSFACNYLFIYHFIIINQPFRGSLFWEAILYSAGNFSCSARYNYTSWKHRYRCSVTIMTCCIQSKAAGRLKWLHYFDWFCQYCCWFQQPSSSPVADHYPCSKKSALSKQHKTCWKQQSKPHKMIGAHLDIAFVSNVAVGQY